MSVDMVPATAGIQDTLKSIVSGEEFFVEFIGSNFTSVSGYQFKVVFDGSKFNYLDIGAADDPMSGKNNILKGNGGAITGIFQKQNNPQCDSILDIAYTINGTTDRSVSGTGLIGIAKFKSKLNSGETGRIRITDGFVVDFSGTKTPVSTYSQGNYKFPMASLITSPAFHESFGPLIISSGKNVLSVKLPDENCTNNYRTEIDIYDLKGRQIAVLFNGFLPQGNFTTSLNHMTAKLTKGNYLCNVRHRNLSETTIVYIGTNQ
jgi:hypothetical protein